MTVEAPSHRRTIAWTTVWFAATIVLVAANLRPAVVAVAPLLTQIQSATGMTATAAGVLTALPVLCFGALAPVAPVLARRIGIERALLIALALLCVGLGIRSSGSLVGLFAGTVLLGAAIATGNVLLPSLIKRDFAAHTGVMTGLYTMAIAGGAALAAGVTVPVATALRLDWKGALAGWAVFVVLALLCWLPQVRRAPRPARASAGGPGGPWRDPLAWQVTAYMGLQSLSYFAITSWLPALLISRGYDPVGAGWLLSLSALAGILGAILAPVLATRTRSQRGMAFGMTMVTAVGMLGLLLLPGLEPVAVCLIGIGQNAALGVALTMVALRAPDAGRAAQLSGMAQTVGYLLAAAGPFAMGFLHDLTGGWTVPLVLLLVLLVVQGSAGVLAGRDRQLAGAR